MLTNLTSVSEIQDTPEKPIKKKKKQKTKKQNKTKKNKTKNKDTPEKQHQCHPPKTIPNAMDSGGSSSVPRDTELQHLLPHLPTSYSFNNVEALGAFNGLDK